MRKRIILMCSFALLFGELFAYSGNPLLILPAAMTGLLSLTGREAKKAVMVLISVSAAFGCGFFRMDFAMDSMAGTQKLLQPGQRAVLTGRVSAKNIKNDKVSYILDSVKTDGGGLLREELYIYVDSDDHPLDSEITVYGTVLEINRAENEGGFDEASYLKSQCIAAKIRAEKIKCVGIDPIGLRERLFGFSAKMSSFYERALPGEEAWIIEAMCLGDKSMLTAEVKDLFSSAGLGHLLAISGLHISLIGNAVYRMLRRFGLSYKMAGGISAAFLILYGVMVGMPVSAQRAIGMYIVLILADVLGEGYDMATAASILMAVILLHNPFSILSAGFVLSFAAVFLLACFVLPLCSLTERLEGNRLIKSFLFSFLIQIVLLPVTLFYYYKFSAFSVFLNLILLPIAAPMVLYSLFIGGLGLVFHAEPLMFPVHLAVHVYEWCCDKSAGLPGGEIVTGQPGVIKIVLYYLILAILFYIIKRSVKKQRLLNDLSPVIKRKRPAPLFGSGANNVLFSVSMIFLILISVFHVPEGFEVVMLSVGQGDGIFISGEDNCTIMIDGGSSSEEKVGENVIKKFLYYRGISEVDVWFLTHMDDDHYNGFLELLKEGFDIGTVVVAEAAEKNDAYYEIMDECKRRGITVAKLCSGEKLIAGGIAFECIWPGKNPQFTGTNENSLCLWMRYENEEGCFDGIFTGDLGSDQELEIIKKNEFDDIELIKGAHHGSKNSNCSDWLSDVDPALCIISAGKKNRYGHPAPETLNRFEKLNIPCLCTIDCGEISVKWEDGKMHVEHFL